MCGPTVLRLRGRGYLIRLMLGIIEFRQLFSRSQAWDGPTFLYRQHTDSFLCCLRTYGSDYLVTVTDARRHGFDLRGGGGGENEHNVLRLLSTLIIHHCCVRYRTTAP